MPSIICSIPQPQDATSLYRAIGPWQSMKREMNRNGRAPLEFILNPDITWMVLKGADFAFFQRPHLDDRLIAMKMCAENGKPTWVDYDDHLHAVPFCNRRFPTYGHPHIQHNIATMLAMADVITVTTPFLGAELAKILKAFPQTQEFKLNPEKIKVVPNAYDDEMHPKMEAKRSERNKLIMWRGSDSHAKDLHTHTEALCQIVPACPDWQWEFVGEPFWLAIEELKKHVKPHALGLTAPMDPVKFFRYMAKQRPALVIVPLEDQTFNRSKSNIAWIEATAAGAVTLAPDWDEWRRPGVITYTRMSEFSSKLLAFMEGEYDADAMWKQSRDYILENLQMKSVNMAREEIMNNLIAK